MVPSFPAPIRGSADQAGAGALLKYKLCIKNYAQECKKKMANAFHFAQTLFKVLFVNEDREAPSAFWP